MMAMSPEERIAQFRTMAEADPDNEMAHFSLGNALVKTGAHTEAAEAFLRCAQVNPKMSRALQMAGEAFKNAGDNTRAIIALQEAHATASELGDALVKQNCAKLLVELGQPLPEIENAPGTSQSGSSTTGNFICHATGVPGSKLDKPPFRGKLGEKIFECISQESWTAWISQGTKVINEFRLDLSREDHEKVYDEQMIEYLRLSDWAAENLQ